MRRVAAIDIGTNTVLLLIAERTADGLNVLHEAQRIPRLGKNVDKTGLIAKDAIHRLVATLEEYKLVAQDYGAELTLVTATSAVRDARNNLELLQTIKSKTGYAIEILSGKEEAELSFYGGLVGLPKIPDRSVGVLDIGGGSTEIAIGTHDRIRYRHSFDMGSVRFTERYLSHPPFSNAELMKVRNTILSTFEDTIKLTDFDQLIGVGGTATTLGVMLRGGELNGISGKMILISELTSFCDKVSRLSPDQILRQHPVLLKGRSDVLLAGALIMEGFLKVAQKDSLTISTGGIRYGVLSKAKIGSKKKAP